MVLEFSDSIGIYHVFKNNINWVFIIYFVKYIRGDIRIMEPLKCMDYRFFAYDELVNSSLVTEGCKFLSKSLKMI